MDVHIAATLLDEFAKLPEQVRDDEGNATEAAMLLDEFAKLPERIERPPTFMEVGGYPHYENVCSNFLAFFFDSEGAHGLGSLFLDALRGAVGDEEEIALSGSISVEREVTTDKGNRIDLLITSDSHVILIENKIFAGVTNPFEDYANHVEREEFRGFTKSKVLLTLKSASEGEEWGFVNLTYPVFIEHVRAMLGNYVSNADTRYLMIALDFLNTLENLQEGSRMNQEFIEFLNERGDEVEKFLDSIRAFRDELRGKVRNLQSFVTLEVHDNVSQSIWRSDSPLFDFLIYEMQVRKDMVIRVCARVEASGWDVFIQLWKGGSLPELQNLLTQLEIPYGDPWRDALGGKALLPYPQRFDYDEDLNVIAPVVRELVEKIASHSH